MEIKMSVVDEHSGPRNIREKYEAVAGITDEFCGEHLSEEYAALSRRMAVVLSRKRPSPFERGRTRSWAAGIIYALG